MPLPDESRSTKASELIKRFEKLSTVSQDAARPLSPQRTGSSSLQPARLDPSRSPSPSSWQPKSPLSSSISATLDVPPKAALNQQAQDPSTVPADVVTPTPEAVQPPQDPIPRPPSPVKTVDVPLQEQSRSTPADPQTQLIPTLLPSAPAVPNEIDTAEHSVVQAIDSPPDVPEATYGPEKADVKASPAPALLSSSNRSPQSVGLHASLAPTIADDDVSKAMPTKQTVRAGPPPSLTLPPASSASSSSGIPHFASPTRASAAHAGSPATSPSVARTRRLSSLTTPSKTLAAGSPSKISPGRTAVVTDRLASGSTAASRSRARETQATTSTAPPAAQRQPSIKAAVPPASRPRASSSVPTSTSTHASAVPRPRVTSTPVASTAASRARAAAIRSSAASAASSPVTKSAPRANPSTGPPRVNRTPGQTSRPVKQAGAGAAAKPVERRPLALTNAKPPAKPEEASDRSISARSHASPLAAKGTAPTGDTAESPLKPFPTVQIAPSDMDQGVQSDVPTASPQPEVKVALNGASMPTMLSDTWGSRDGGAPLSRTSSTRSDATSEGGEKKVPAWMKKGGGY